jgi:hypothetical protein
VAEFGTRCNPDPAVDAASPAGLARPSSDFSTGARPGLLRGLFGFILLSNGQIAVVDEDDFDADCRRPSSVNQSAIPDFRGCANDPYSADLLTPTGGQPLVTNEVSCRIVQPHRFRSSRFAINDTTLGVDAPSLREQPQLNVPPVASNSAFSDRPRLLAVPFVGPNGGAVAADVYVGSTRLSTSPNAGTDWVATDPNDKSSEALQTQHSVVLPPLEQRSYASSDTVSVTYEGSLFGDAQNEQTSGFLGGGGGDWTFTDPFLSFCGKGVYDVATMKGYAQSELGIASDSEADAFAVAHADYVQLTTDFLPATDSYWRQAGIPKRADCLTEFGAQDADPLLHTRDFRITHAFAGRLVIEPRDPAKPIDWKLLTGCFPEAQTYRIRAGKQWVVRHAALGFRHDIVASGADQQCVRSCDPLRKWSRGRVFEISSRNEPGQCRAVDEPGEPLDLRVGCAKPADVACVYDQIGPDGKSRGVPLDDPAAACIFNGLNERFALYRGRSESERDSTFTWQTSGGFIPLAMTLTSLSAVVAPQSIQFLQAPEQMAVVDGASQGLSLFSLDTFSVVKPSPFF